MRHPSQITPHAFRTSARERLSDYVARGGGEAGRIVALTPDASTREYFRIPWKTGEAVAAVYPEPFDPEIHPFLDVTRLFAEAELPVPEILDVDALNGIIVQEDFGDKQLRRVFESGSEDECESYVEQAVGLIADIQSATALAYDRQSIASRLAFDEAKLSWELDFFMEHYFKSLRGEELKHGDEAQLRAELNDVSAELAARPRTLCHRDFHPSNLMVDASGRLRIIDYQDARMGPASYDLVSLLLDRRTTMPSLAEVRERRLFFLGERKSRGLEAAGSPTRVRAPSPCSRNCATGRASSSASSSKKQSRPKSGMRSATWGKSRRSSYAARCAPTNARRAASRLTLRTPKFYSAS